MDAVELARSLAHGGRIHEFGTGSNRTFRIFRGQTPLVLKVYSSPAAARREARAFEALAGLEGLPEVVERAETDDLTWVMLTDPGQWTLDSLPESPSAARKAGAILKALHSMGDAALTNLSGGMTPEQIAADYTSLFQRIERYRGRLSMGADIIEAARRAPAPRSSKATPSHANPRPEKFHVDDQGAVTLMDWAWATMAPPEWDFSLAFWTTSRQVGDRAAQALAEGYGAALGERDLAPWVVYHIGSFLLREAETTSGRLDNLSPLIDEMAANLV